MYTVPLYEDLCGGTMKSFAVEVFYQTQARLHINLRRTVQQILAQTFSAFVTRVETMPACPRWSLTLSAWKAGGDDACAASLVTDAVCMEDLNFNALAMARQFYEPSLRPSHNQSAGAFKPHTAQLYWGVILY
ncbi:UNVERIFIED_CONTAM: hypothetical protein FKN15_038513 [Acipenser sinensis]